MKTNLKTLGSLAILLIATFGARAEVVLQENFDSYLTGPLTNNFGNTFWVGHSGAGDAANSADVVADPFATAPNALQVSQARAQDVNAKLTNQPYALPAGSPFATNNLGQPVAALYSSFKINVTTVPSVSSGSQTYFTHFIQGTSNFKGRVFIITNNAAPGNFRLAIQNSGSAITNVVPSGDLVPGTSYTLVTRYVLSSGIATIWLSPTSETDVSTNGTDTPSVTSITGYAFRQAGGEGVIDVDDLVVATSFADVVPGSVNPATIVIQPNDTNVFIGGRVTLKTLAVGDPTIDYRWYYNTNTLITDDLVSVSGASTPVLTLTNIIVGQAGTYSCVASNAAGTNMTRFATLIVNTTPIPPTITNQPVDFTSIVGDTATFSVVAGGSTPLSFKWKVDNGVATNDVAGAGIGGTNSPTLIITNITTALSGLKYFVTVTNAFGATNSAKVLLTVNPPALGTIADLHAQIDMSLTTFAPSNTAILHKVRGIVTTWTSMTSGAGSTLFYMQDDSGGIPVFWSGAPAAANLPPAGALVEVVGPLTQFSGLLEIQPVFTNTLHSVTVISTGNPLPAAQPLPFDAFLATNTPAMKKLESSYFVASNVFLANGGVGNFVGNNSSFLTNIATVSTSFTNSYLNLLYTNHAGDTFQFFVNASTDIPNQPIPSGPVTIYGVLGYHTPEGFQFTPSRYADILVPTQFTNILSNVTRYGDLLTNSFSENVLRTNETLDIGIVITDPGGSSVTISPSTEGLPPSAIWSGVASGFAATAHFHFTPTPDDAGTNYVVGVGYTINSVTSSNYWYVYVPTPDEQKMYISEFLANPTTNINSGYFNPLHRSVDDTNITTVDQYVEIVNLSGTDITDLYGWSITDASTRRYTSQSGFEQLPANSAAVIYSGAGNSPPTIPNSYQANVGSPESLSLKTTGTGVIVLRNPGYFNNGLGIKPGYIVDRVVYKGTDLKNGSLSRFPTINDSFVPQAYIATATNFSTAGLQYDGAPWSDSTQTPASVSNIVITGGNPVTLSFTANTNQSSTLWSADTITDKFRVISGNQFTNAAAVFSLSNTPPNMQFYFITTQTNY